MIINKLFENQEFNFNTSQNAYAFMNVASSTASINNDVRMIQTTVQVLVHTD